MKKQLNNRPELRSRRRDLRNNSTSAEAVLWTMLKNSQLEGLKFRRQHSFGSYILDFYCPSKKLVVELDGSIHHDPDQLEYDERRTDFLNSNGLTVIRIENKNVFNNPGMVLDYIRQHLK